MAFSKSNATPQFQSPNIPGLVRQNPDLGGGLETLFNQYMQMQQAKRQEAALPGQLLAQQQQTQLGAQQLAAGNRQAAMADTQETAQFGAPLTAIPAQDIAQAGVQSRPDFAGPINPRYAKLAEGLHAIGEKSKQATRMSEAQTRDVEAQAKLREAQAANGGYRPGGMGGMNASPTDEQVDAVARDFASGGIPAKDFGQMIGKSAPADRYRLYAAVKKFNPDYNMAEMSMKFAEETTGRQASARLTEGGSSQVVARAANSAVEQLDTLQEMSNKFPRSDVRFMNTAINAIDVQTHPEAANWRVALNSARTEYATALNRGNSPTEELMKEAKMAIPDNITPKQLPGAIATMRRGLEATVKGQMTPAGKSGHAPATSDHSALLDKYGAP